MTYHKKHLVFFSGHTVYVCVQSWGGTAGLIDTMEKTSKQDKDGKVVSRLKSRTEIDSYAECYPGYFSFVVLDCFEC